MTPDIAITMALLGNIGIACLGVFVLSLVYNIVTNYLDTRRFRRGFAADDRAAEREDQR